MANYDYKVVSFMGNVNVGIGGSFSAEQAAEQLAKIIQQNVVGGWEFYRIDQVRISAKPGCLASLFAMIPVIGSGISGDAVISYDLVTFRKEK